MITFLVILWSISSSVAIILVVWTILGNVIAIYFNQALK
jgi:putative ATP-binding cassette transporter